MPSKLTITDLKAAKPGSADYFLWDKSLTGFGVKICRGGRKTFVCQYRQERGRRGSTRRLTIGQFGVLTLDQARQRARCILGAVAHGDDPAQEEQTKRVEPTVGELCDLYLAHGTGPKKPSTIATDRGRIERHIKPLLGSRKVTDIKKTDITRFMNQVANGKTAADIKTGKHGRARVTGGKGTASRTVGLLGGIFSYANDAGLISTNPVRGVRRYRDKKVENYLSVGEFRILGKIMDEALASETNPNAIAIIKLLILTGARRGEIQSLKWCEVDLERGFLRLQDSKTGQKIILLNRWACEVIDSQMKQTGSEYVFPAARGNGHFTGTWKVWSKLRKDTSLERYRIHDFRHSFASLAVQSGASLPLIGGLLGQKDAATTQRYAHLSDNPMRQVADMTGSAIVKAFEYSGGQTVDAAA